LTPCGCGGGGYTGEKNDDVSVRLKILVDDITLSMYTNICRGLFEKDKLLYSFMISANIHRQEGSITDQEWKCYVVGPGTADAAAMKKYIPPLKQVTW